MAIFCYRDEEGGLTEVSFPVGEAPPTVRVKRGNRELVATRSFQDELFQPRRPGKWPMYSYSTAIAPEDVPRAVADMEKHGVKAEFHADGRMKFNSALHRKKCCEALGMYDKNAGYGDPQPGRKR